jgi:hypothetical protein
MGVWKQVGRTFDLNHIGLGLDLKTGKYVGPANIRAKVKVDRGAWVSTTKYQPVNVGRARYSCRWRPVTLRKV